jgi:hypothetical protein
VLLRWRRAISETSYRITTAANDLSARIARWNPRRILASRR